MDLLADILKMAGLQGRMIYKKSIQKSQLLQFPCEKSLGFHVILKGEVELVYGKNKKQVLKTGDVALMSRGVHHQLINKSNHEVTFVSGVYQLWNDPIHPFFLELPDWWVLRSNELEMHDTFHSTLKILSAEVASPDLATESIMQSLLDILFNLILRKLMKSNAVQKNPNWGKASQDERISKALQLMHKKFNYPWSLEEISETVGLSRAGFAQKFKNALGDTPLNYLSSLRIQQAMKMLSEEDHKIEVVAQNVGYSDAFTFSKAFKKKTGQSPLDFRKKMQIDRLSEMRF